MRRHDFHASWLERFHQWRDLLIANPRFQRWALNNPITRFGARREMRAMLDLCSGFVYSQILFACVRLRLFEMLIDGPMTTDAIAERVDLSKDAASRLLDAATSIRLLERRGKNRYALGRLGAALVGNEAALSLIEHQPLLYADLQDPIALLRGASSKRGIADYWPYSETSSPSALSAEQVAPYSALMAASQPIVAREALSAYPLHMKRKLLDVGGGEGVFLMEAARCAPQLELMLFDLPAVVDRARDRFASANLLERATIHGGDFLRDPLPRGADVISLVRIVHDHDDATALTLLTKVREALAPGGELIIVEAMSGTPGAEPLDAYYGFYTLAMRRGEPRTFEEIGRLLRQAGFGRWRLLRNNAPIVASVIVAGLDAR